MKKLKKLISKVKKAATPFRKWLNIYSFSYLALIVAFILGAGLASMTK